MVTTDHDGSQHFAVGLTVSVKDGEIPPGLDEFDQAPPKHRQISAVSDDGMYEVAGWYWNADQLLFEH